MRRRLRGLAKLVETCEQHAITIERNDHEHGTSYTISTMDGLFSVDATTLHGALDVAATELEHVR